MGAAANVRDMVVASFALLDQVCRRAALTYRKDLRRFEVCFSDLGETWSFDPRGRGQCFVRGSLGEVDLRLHVAAIDWLRFILARSGDADVSGFVLEGDVACLDPFMSALPRHSWLASQTGER